MDCIQVLDSFSDGIYSITTIKRWLLKYQHDYTRIHKQESNRFLYFINGKWARLPDYLDIRTPNEKFLHLYDALNKVSESHKHESYFKQEMAIYKIIKNEPEKVREWLTKNEYLGSNEYFMFSIDGFKDINLDRFDFRYTLEFIETFDSIYWGLLEELKLDNLN